MAKAQTTCHGKKWSIEKKTNKHARPHAKSQCQCQTWEGCQVSASRKQVHGKKQKYAARDKGKWLSPTTSAALMRDSVSRLPPSTTCVPNTQPVQDSKAHAIRLCHPAVRMLRRPRCLSHRPSKLLQRIIRGFDLNADRPRLTSKWLWASPSTFVMALQAKLIPSAP